MNLIEGHHRRPRATRVQRLAGVVVIAAVGAFLVGCSSSGDPRSGKAQAAGPARAVSVAIAPVQRQDVPVYLSGLGSVTAFNTANIKSRVDGQIMKVNFREGQGVHQGELLIEIDSRAFQVQVEQLQAQLFRDQAQLRDARLNLERYTALIPSGSIAQQQVDTQKALVDQLDGTVRNDQAQIDSAKLNITYCHITAPFDGRADSDATSAHCGDFYATRRCFTKSGAADAARYAGSGRIQSRRSNQARNRKAADDR